MSEKVVLFNRVEELKNKLSETDYVSNKLTEAIAEYVIKGDSSAVVAVYDEYREILSLRKSWRDEINQCEVRLNELHEEYLARIKEKAAMREAPTYEHETQEEQVTEDEL